jgi:hypothetical protein
MVLSIDGIPVVWVRSGDPSRKEMTVGEYQQLQMLDAFHPELVSERLQAWKDAPLSPGRGCLLCYTQPCGGLLTDPFGTLLDEKRWPGHFSRDVGTELNARWVRSLQERVRNCGMDCDAEELTRPDARPLPVGRESLRRRYASRNISSELPTALLPLMPFDGDEYAMFVIFGQFLSVDLTLFFMASHGTGGLYRAAGLRWQMRGERRLTTDAATRLTRLVASAERFWAVFEGSPIPFIGRRPALTADDIPRIRALVEEYERIADESGFDRIRQDDFADFVGHDVKTLRPFMRDNGIPWPQIRRD